MIRLYMVGCEGKFKVELACGVVCVGVGMGWGGMGYEGEGGRSYEVDCKVVIGV